MRKRLALGLLAATLCAMHTVAAGVAATIASTPSPIVATQNFEITIKTSDFGQDVYCYTWTVGGSQPDFDWANAISDKYKMTGSGGVYSLKVDNIKDFYGLNDSQVESLSKIGFIARTSSGKQTEDLFVEVVSQRYSGGAGTSEKPYLLSTAADLQCLADSPADWGMHFEVTGDISLADDFKGVGSMDSPFTGVFNGNHKTIGGVKVSGNGGVGSATGFFNALGQGASVHDLGLKRVSVSGATYCGGLAGFAASGAAIARCYTSGIVNGSSICIGGLVGENRGSVADCYSTAKVTSEGDYAAGGLVGKNTGIIERAYASGDVTACNYVGAVVGANYGVVLYSVAMNQMITSASGSKYAGRFGGNNNSENDVKGAGARAAADGDTNLSWSGMNHSQGTWDDFAHHAADANQALGEKATYTTGLGWDFNNTWTWVGKDGADAQSTATEQRYPVLAGIEGQEAPAGEYFYEMTAIEVPAADTAAAGIAVFPTLVENTFSVSAPAAITALHITAVNGANVLTLRGDGSQEMAVDFSGAVPGVYFLNVTMSDGSHGSMRLLKK